MNSRDPAVFTPGEDLERMCEAAREVAFADAERRHIDWDGVEAVRKRRRIGRRAAAVGGLLAAAALAAVLLWPAIGGDPMPAGSSKPTAATAAPVPRYRIVRPNDAVYVVAEETARWTLRSAAALDLSSGTVWARVDATEGPVPFEVRTPEASVRVEGTRFAVSHRSGAGTSVYTLDGRVRVAWKGRTFFQVHGGMQWEPGDIAPMPLRPAHRVRLADLLPDTVVGAGAVPRGAETSPVAAAILPDKPPNPETTIEPPPPAGPEARPAEPPPETGPTVPPAATGGSSPASSPSTGERLYRQAEESIATGRMDEAIVLLWRIVEREPRSPRAGLALMDLGRLAQRLGRPADAARAFGRYLDLQPNGSFRDDARIGLCRALGRSGESDAARSCYASYLADLPRGAHAGEARQATDRSP